MTDISQDAPGHNRLPPLPGEPDRDAIFAQRVRVLREAAQLTQRQVADKMTFAGYRMHQTTIAKIEAGERPVYVGEAVALAGVLGVGIGDLITEPREGDVITALAERSRWAARVNELATEAQTLQSKLADTQARLADAQQNLAIASARAQQLHDAGFSSAEAAARYRARRAERTRVTE